MKTTKDERDDWATTDWCPDEEPCYAEEGTPHLGGITFCVNDVTTRLIDDVDDAAELVKALAACCIGHPHRPNELLDLAAAFLKEPKQ